MKKRFRKQCLTTALAVMLLLTFSAIAANSVEQPPLDVEHDDCGHNHKVTAFNYDASQLLRDFKDYPTEDEFDNCDTHETCNHNHDNRGATFVEIDNRQLLLEFNDYPTEEEYDACRRGYVEFNASVAPLAACTSHVPGDWIISGEYHYRLCKICSSQLEHATHSYKRQSIDASTHLRYCTVCGFSETYAHNPGSWIITETYHHKDCTQCGGLILHGNHTSSGWTSNGTSHYNVCGTCAYIYNSASHTYKLVGNNMVCSICGRVQPYMSPESTDLPEIEQTPDADDFADDDQANDSALQEKDQTPEFAGLPEDIQIPAND